MHYEICGLGFESEEPFPELTPVARAARDVSLRLRKVASIKTAPAIWSAPKWTLPNGCPFLIISKTANGYLLQFEKLADFFINQSATEVEYCPRPEVPAVSVRHLILDNVMAFVLSVQGCSVLHSSAVVTPYGACAFAANTGVGKSTLAASFQHRGYATLTDDCLLLEAHGTAVYGLPSYPSIRLRSDTLAMLGIQHDTTQTVAHYNSKRRMAAGRFATRRYRLAAIYCLERASGDEPREARLEPLSGRDAMVTVLRQMFCLDPNEPSMLVRQFKMLEQISSWVRIVKMVIPNDFSTLPAVHETVLEDLKANSQAGLSVVR